MAKDHGLPLTPGKAEVRSGRNVPAMDEPDEQRARFIVRLVENPTAVREELAARRLCFARQQAVAARALVESLQHDLAQFKSSEEKTRGQAQLSVAREWQREASARLVKLERSDGT